MLNQIAKFVNTINDKDQVIKQLQQVVRRHDEKMAVKEKKNEAISKALEDLKQQVRLRPGKHAVSALGGVHSRYRTKHWPYLRSVLDCNSRQRRSGRISEVAAHRHKV